MPQETEAVLWENDLDEIKIFQFLQKKVGITASCSTFSMEAFTMPPETYSNDFGGFLELMSRFEFEFCRCGNYFFDGFEFLVRSCECAVACLCPRISISNVLAQEKWLATRARTNAEEVSKNWRVWRAEERKRG